MKKNKRHKRHKRFKFVAADARRIEQEQNAPKLRHASVQGKRVGVEAYVQSKGVSLSEVREAMHVEHPRREAKSGLSLSEVLRASPWRKSNYPV